jgi:hypothetical protein
LGGVWVENPGTLKASLAPTVLVRGRDAALLGRFGINALAPATGGTTSLVGNVTLGGASSISRFWQRLDRRRLFLFILKSIEEATTWVAHRLDPERTADDLDAQVRAFLQGLFEHGALAGSAPAQAFFVAVRRASTPEPAVLLRFGVALLKTSDFLAYEICYDARGSSTRAVPSLEVEQLLL